MDKLIVAGNGTGVGKTLVAAILSHALGADYWKPIQCGLPGDSERVRELCPTCYIHPEAYRLAARLSPHAAGTIEDIVPPSTTNSLVIEPAGGLLVPLNLRTLQIDLYSKWNASWIIVSRHYLGSINHTLLTVEALKQRGCQIRGVIFNGTPNPSSEEAILHFTGLPIIGRLLPRFTQKRIGHYAKSWKL